MEHQEGFDTTTERLEWVRKHVAKNMSVKDFHAYLRDRAGLELSYTGSRKYHAGREAPAAYLAAVAKAWTVSLTWLVTGEGWPSADFAVDIDLSGNFTPIDDLQVELQELFPEALDGELDRLSDTNIWPVWKAYTAKLHDSRGSERAVAGAFAAPLKILGLELGRASPYRRRMYFSLMQSALESMLVDDVDVAGQPWEALGQQPEEGSGDPVAEE